MKSERQSDRLDSNREAALTDLSGPAVSFAAKPLATIESDSFKTWQIDDLCD